MSLLLDALKRAEQEKLAREASNDAPPPAPQAAPSPRPVPAFELQPLGGPAVAGTATRAEDSAHAAQLMFDAKSAAPLQAKRSNGMLWATLAAIGIVVCSAGAYVWYQVRLLSPAPAPVAVRRLPPPPLPQMASGSPPPAPVESGTPARPASVTLAEPAPAAPVSVAAAPATAAHAESSDDMVARLLKQAPAAQAEPPLRLARSVDRPAIPADVSAGYTALRSGDLASARKHYQAALADDASSIDARIGLATVEARSGNATLATGHYRRVLELDPRNATALAALAALADNASPRAVESQLKEDVARFPESVPLRFALGTHYASQRRWGEAQAAFYEAYRLDPSGADILYNLAVSLDHMNQQRLAAEFYRRAVEAARAQPAQFDPAPVRRRIAELSER